MPAGFWQSSARDAACPLPSPATGVRHVAACVLPGHPGGTCVFPRPCLAFPAASLILFPPKQPGSVPSILARQMQRFVCRLSFASCFGFVSQRGDLHRSTFIIICGIEAH